MLKHLVEHQGLSNHACGISNMLLTMRNEYHATQKTNNNSIHVHHPTSIILGNPTECLLHDF